MRLGRRLLWCNGILLILGEDYYSVLLWMMDTTIGEWSTSAETEPFQFTLAMYHVRTINDWWEYETQISRHAQGASDDLIDAWRRITIFRYVPDLRWLVRVPTGPEATLGYFLLYWCPLGKVPSTVNHVHCNASAAYQLRIPMSQISTSSTPF